MANTSSTANVENRERNLETSENKPEMGGVRQGNDLRSTVGDILGSDKAREFVGKAQESARSAMDKASEVAGQLQDTASEYADTASEYLRRYPIQSVLVGFGVGLLVGALLSPKRMA